MIKPGQISKEISARDSHLIRRETDVKTHVSLSFHVAMATHITPL
jgi:hypothetical protein